MQLSLRWIHVVYAAIWTYKYQCKLSYECVTDQEQDIDILELNTFRNIYKVVISSQYNFWWIPEQKRTL